MDGIGRAVLGLAVVFALAGCTSSNSARSEHPHSSGPLTAVQIATGDANGVISSMSAIHDAVRLAKAPAVFDGSGAGYSAEPFTPLEVDGWYDVAAPYATALAEAKAILAPDDHGPVSDGYGHTHGLQFLEFMLDHLYPGTLGNRWITVTTFELTAQTSELEVSVSEGYRPDKPAAEHFPAGGVLDVALSPDIYQAKPTATREITDPAKIAQIAGILNALPTVPLEAPSSCPAMDAQTTVDVTLLKLTFRATAGGPALITATVTSTLKNEEGIDDCDGAGIVQVTVGSTGEPMLDSTGQPVYARITALAALPGGA
ncbi:hypothetical protein KDL01_12810 [Actinospica durhamensis]|uniref:Uncharacterized protein n=1 Tax=Actinospica durhamensis TaxID=1508375 RepID=A0A941IRP8_9ACTN|nr:hypothetical protein [Actinospica durhamensis]MBR7834148.1 hypothetical protein [Actinospica durhamensis]